MINLPSGTVTFLFTDIEGSTMICNENSRPSPGEKKPIKVCIGIQIDEQERVLCPLLFLLSWLNYGFATEMGGDQSLSAKKKYD